MSSLHLMQFFWGILSPSSTVLTLNKYRCCNVTLKSDFLNDSQNSVTAQIMTTSPGSILL